MATVNHNPSPGPIPDHRPKQTPSPCVVGSVLCEYCHTGYVPTPEQSAVLLATPDFTEWTNTATAYAIHAGWHQRTDRFLLCTQHAQIGDAPLPPKMTWKELCRRWPTKRDTPTQ